MSIFVWNFPETSPNWLSIRDLLPKPILVYQGANLDPKNKDLDIEVTFFMKSVTFPIKGNYLLRIIE